MNTNSSAAEAARMGTCTGKFANAVQNKPASYGNVPSKATARPEHTKPSSPTARSDHSKPSSPTERSDHGKSFETTKKERKEAALVKKKKLLFSEPIPRFVTDGGVENEAADFETNVYIRGKLLGKGGFARCFQIELIRKNGSVVGGEMFAVKAVQKSFLDSKESHWTRWRNEVALTISCAHPHLVQALDAFEDSKFCYMRMAMYRTRTLKDLLRHRTTLTECETRYFLSHMLQGLRAFHAMGFVHRDVKMGNMFLDSSMQLRIGDYGLSKKMTDRHRTFTLCGTPNYLAPEILGKCGYSFPVDVWAVGCAGFALLRGRPPFQTTQLQKTYRLIKASVVTYPDAWSDSVVELLDRCMRHISSARPTPDQALRKCHFLRAETPFELPASIFFTPFDPALATKGED
jgi:polo-like kinase 1